MLFTGISRLSDWLSCLKLGLSLAAARGVEVTSPGGVGLSLLDTLMSMSELLARLARCSSVSLSVSPQLSWSLLPALDSWDSTLAARPLLCPGHPATAGLAAL